MGIVLREYVANGPGPLRVDREAGTISDVKILGRKSLNGREYPPETVERAKRLYEGLAVSVNHRAAGTSGDRSAYDRFGWLEGIYARAGELYARKFHYLKSHPLAGPIAEAAERNPKLFGFSHDARGRTGTRGGKTVIEEIESVRSVDVVADPASVSGLFESLGVPAMNRMTVRELLERLAPRRPRAAAGFRRIAEEAGMGSDTVLDAGSGIDPSVEQSFRDGFKKAFEQVIEADLPIKEKLRRIEALLVKQQELLPAAKAEDDGDTAAAPDLQLPPAPGVATESRRWGRHATVEGFTRGLLEGREPWERPGTVEEFVRRLTRR